MWRGMRVCWLLLMMASVYSTAHAAESPAKEPPIPSRPKTDEDCVSWGEKLYSYWNNKVIKIAKENDSHCIKAIDRPLTGLCGNVSAEVKYNLCNTEDKYTQCTVIQKDRGVQECRKLLAKLTNQPIKNLKQTTFPSKDTTAPTEQNKGGASTKSDCFPGTQACMTACLNAGESDHSECTKGCFATDTIGRGYCCERAR